VDGRVYHRVVTDKPIWWREDICAENNVHVGIAKRSLLPERGRLADAGQEELSAAGSAVFQAIPR